MGVALDTIYSHRGKKKKSFDGPVEMCFVSFRFLDSE